MAKALFFSLPLHGHTNPSLPLVRELVRRGDEVIYYSNDTFAEKVARADIVTFTSSSTVSGFIENVGDLHIALAGKAIACIGPITAGTAREAGMHVDVIADAFTVEGLMDALSATATA